MTKEEARIVVLEDALGEAYHKIQFMHGCLTDPNNYRYAYPQMTENQLHEIEWLIDPPFTCPHSVFSPDCYACKDREKRRQLLTEALTVLDKDD